MPDEQLKALCKGMAMPDFAAFSDSELEAITSGSATDELARRYDTAIRAAQR
jgi:hypothetical protein